MADIISVAESSAGSNAFFVFGLLGICLLVLLLLRYYLPLRKTPAYLLVPVFLALAVPASIILLVPIDLASVRGGNGEDEGGRGIWLPQRALLVCWRIGYWLTFGLTWAILPLLGEYSDAGYLSPKSRFYYSLRSNGQYWMIVGGSGILGAVYFFLNSGFHITTLKSLVMALAYAWGLILAIYLMGHGLVALPRKLWKEASISGRLKATQEHAPKVHEKLIDAIDNLQEYDQQVIQLRQKRNTVPKEFHEWIEELYESSSLPESSPSMTPRQASVTVPAVVTEKYLADLTRRVKRARHAKLRFEYEWARLVSSATFSQATLDASASGKLDASSGSTPFNNSGFWTRLGRRTLTPSMRYYLHARIVPSIYYSLSAFLGLASFAVVWSECTKSFSSKINIVGRSIVHHPSAPTGAQIGFAGQCIAAFWLCYMVLSALFAVTEVKIWGNRALVRRNTYSESACWYSQQVAKLTVPLSYNFITFLDGDIYKETSFFGFLGKLINFTPLGSGFSRYFPMLIIVPVAATAFGLYGRVKRILGLGEYMEIGDEDDGVGVGGWREGRALIDRELHGNGLLQSSNSSGSLLGLSSRDVSPSPRVSSAVNQARQQRLNPETRPPREERRPFVPSNAAEDDAAEVQGSWLGDFTHRVRNTIETSDFTVPKWMKPGNEGGNESGSGNGNGNANENGANASLGRWFGGTRREGGVRLR